MIKELGQKYLGEAEKFLNKLEMEKKVASTITEGCICTTYLYIRISIQRNGGLFFFFWTISSARMLCGGFDYTKLLGKEQ